MRNGGNAGVGNRVGPPRFIAFLLVLMAALPGTLHLLEPVPGYLAAFDAAALVFILSTAPLFAKKVEARNMRETARRNDANRLLLLAISGLLCLTVLCAVALELGAERRPDMAITALVIGSLAVTWVFGNLVYAMHYAHIHYTTDERGKDMGGLDFPGAKEPDYWDFLYFAFTLGMTFQTSDVEISSRQMRRIALFHSAAAFVFNIGVLAFTINVIGN